MSHQSVYLSAAGFYLPETLIVAKRYRLKRCTGPMLDSYSQVVKA